MNVVSASNSVQKQDPNDNTAPPAL